MPFPKLPPRLGTNAAGSAVATAVASRIDPSVAQRIGGIVNAGLAIKELLNASAYMDEPKAINDYQSNAKRKETYFTHRKLKYAHREFFWVAIKETVFKPIGDLPRDSSGSVALGGVAVVNVRTPINMLVTDVSYSHTTIQGDAVQIGAANVDTVTGTEPVDITLTALDTREGDLRRQWDRWVGSRVNAQTGLFGLPNSRMLEMTIHSFTEEAADALAAYEKSGADEALIYKPQLNDVYYVRPDSLTKEFSRRDSGLLELQMRFREVDGFMRPLADPPKKT